MEKKLGKSVSPVVGITKVQELVYELTISQVMSSPVVTVTPATPMSQLRESLRTRKISGSPVLDGDRLVGIVSIEDLFKCLAQGNMDQPVSDWMCSRVITVREEESVIEAVKSFAEFGVGRLPVVDAQGRLVGILTGGDITRGLLEAIDLDYHQEEIERYRASHIFEDIVSDNTSLILRYRIPKEDFQRGGEASSKIRRALDRLGANPQTLRRVGIAAYEAEMNIVIHSLDGGEMTTEVHPHLVRIVAQDRGPGIEDVEKALEPGYSTAPEWIRELGFGAGMGLQNIRKCSDSMDLTSRPGEGTRLEIVVRVESNHAREG
jgi:CBS domain-containing protein/anti-sigma regulatory factor (Ser/Thr protein kinase)